MLVQIDNMWRTGLKRDEGWDKAKVLYCVQPYASVMRSGIPINGNVEG